MPVCCSHGVRLGDLYHNTSGSDGNIPQVIEKKIELGQQKQRQSLVVILRLYNHNIFLPRWTHLAANSNIRRLDNCRHISFRLNTLQCVCDAHSIALIRFCTSCLVL